MSDSDDEYIPDDAFDNSPPPAPTSRLRVPPPRQQSTRLTNPSNFMQDMMNNMMGGMVGPGLGMGMGMGGGRGFGGHPGMAAPPSAFSKVYKAYSTAILEIKEGRGGGIGGGRDNVMFGGNIIMPPSALAQLVELELPNPYIFELKNPYKQSLKAVHAGVIEFLAEEGTVHLPNWMMNQLNLSEGDQIRLQGCSLPRGKRIIIQPQSVLFLELSDPKSVLEQALRNFPCLTPGSTIEISYNSMAFEILIKSALPEDAVGISTLNVDLEVDFEAPPGYVEPTYKKPEAKPIPTMREKLKIDLSSTQLVDEKGRFSHPSSARASPAPSGDVKAKGKEKEVKDEEKPRDWEAFKGSGNTLQGKRVKGKGVSGKKIEELEKGSRIARTDQPKIITPDTQIGGREIPAPLNLPDGVLFFGFNKKPHAGDGKGGKDGAGEKREAFEGKGNTLRGGGGGSGRR